MGETFEQLLEILKAKGEALGDATAHEQELEDDRAAIKADAVTRIMKRDNLAATPAEKIVETDEEYFRHRAKQRASIVARFRADAEYEAAKAAATNASLHTPSIIELKVQVSRLKREIDLKEIALRRANGYLADRIHDVDTLTEVNRKFREQLGLEPTRPVPFDTLEPARGSVAALTSFASDPRD